MGSRYFVDFQMVHKFLSMSKMISFEKDDENIRRFEFNLPYKFIDLKSGLSTEILPFLDWSKDFLLWLDYDNSVAPYIIEDIEIVCDNAKSGTILILTIDAEPRRFDDGFPEDENIRLEMRLSKLKESIYPHYPPDIKNSTLSKKKFPEILLRIIRERIRDCLAIKDLNFYQLFNFIYEDSSQMCTFGCIFEKYSLILPINLKCLKWIMINFENTRNIISIILNILKPIYKYED